MILNTNIEEDLSEASFESALLLLQIKSFQVLKLTITVNPFNITEAGRVTANLGRFENVTIFLEVDDNFKEGEWMITASNGWFVRSKGSF